MFRLGQLLQKVFSAPIGARKRSSLVQMASSYGLQAVGMVQGFVLIPIYIEYIGAEQFGFWLATGGVLVALYFFDLGLSQPINQKISYHNGRDETAEASQWFWTGLACYLAVLFAAMLPVQIIASQLPKLLSIPFSYRGDFELAIMIAYSATLLKILGDFFQGYASAVLRPGLPSMGLVVGQLTGITLNIFLILNGYGVVAIALGLMAAQAISFGVNLVFLFRAYDQGLLLWCPPSRLALKRVRTFVVYTMFVKAFMRFTQQAEPFVLTLFIGPESAALYGVNKKVADLLERLVSVIWGSSFYSIANFAGAKARHDLDHVARLLLRLLIGAITILATGYIAYNTRFVSWWVSSDMTLPILIITLIGIGRISEIATNFLSEMHIALGNIPFAAKGLLAFITLRFALICLLVWLFGMAGAPIAVVTATLLSAVFFYRTLQTREKLLIFPMTGVARFIGAITTSVMMGVAAASLLPDITSDVGAIAVAAAVTSLPGAAWLYSLYGSRLAASPKRDTPICKR